MGLLGTGDSATDDSLSVTTRRDRPQRCRHANREESR